MMQKSIQSRLFLVGCPRSGTTLLQSMLASHSQIASFPESHFLLVTSRTRRARWMRKLGLVSPEMRQQLRQFLIETSHPNLVPRKLYLLDSFSAAFIDVLDQVALSHGKPIWLEKTPGHLYYIRDFERVLPDARFIHLIRNGADVVASLYEVANQYPQRWGARYSIEQCIATWHRCMELSKAYCTKANHLWVEYEQLVSDPAATLTNLSGFVGVDFEAEMITGQARSAEKLIRKDEPWKSQTYEGTIQPQPRKFEQIFSPDQQTEILRKLSNFE